jgi:hypothetical protein
VPPTASSPEHRSRPFFALEQCRVLWIAKRGRGIIDLAGLITGDDEAKVEICL